LSTRKLVTTEDTTYASIIRVETTAGKSAAMRVTDIWTMTEALCTRA